MIERHTQLVMASWRQSVEEITLLSMHAHTPKQLQKTHILQSFIKQALPPAASFSQQSCICTEPYDRQHHPGFATTKTTKHIRFKGTAISSAYTTQGYTNTNSSCSSIN
jgi:hypothetical protein